MWFDHSALHPQHKSQAATYYLQHIPIEGFLLKKALKKIQGITAYTSIVKVLW